MTSAVMCDVPRFCGNGVGEDVEYVVKSNLKMLVMPQVAHVEGNHSIAMITICTCLCIVKYALYFYPLSSIAWLSFIISVRIYNCLVSGEWWDRSTNLSTKGCDLIIHIDAEFKQMISPSDE